MTEFLLYARDVLTVMIIGGIMLWCALHEHVAWVRELLAEKKQKQVVKPAKKFNGSAATYVR